MAAIYSTRFLSGLVHASLNISYTVPSGYVAVVRSISGYNAGSGAGNFVAFNSASGTLFAVVGVVVDATCNLECRHVLNAGDTLTCSASWTSGQATVSGYLLSAP